MNFEKNDLSKAREGDRLWNYYDQAWEVVESVRPQFEFPIDFESGNSCDFKGRETTDDIVSTYFWNEIHFDIPERPKRKAKKEIKVWAVVSKKGEIYMLHSSEPAVNSPDYMLLELVKEIEIEE